MAIIGVPIADPDDEETLTYAFTNMYIFSVGLLGLYIYPWFIPGYTWFERLEKMTFNWLALSVFEEMFFQVTHNLIEGYLYRVQGKGSVLEWPYFVYGLCDSRWNDYSFNKGLAWEIYTNNMLEGGSGTIIIIILFLEKYYWKISKHIDESELNQNIVSHVNSQRKRYPHSLLLILVIIFRDAMLFRQTFSYMSDQHLENYPFSFRNSSGDFPNAFRPLAIGGLWFINGIWLIAPITSLFWAWRELTHRDMLHTDESRIGKNNENDRVEMEAV